MVAIPDSVRAALTAGHLAHLVTLAADGSPQVSIVWVGVDGDEIVSGHLDLRQKLRNIQRDPRVALSFETGGPILHGFAGQYLVIHGIGRITEGGAPELLQRLAHTYVGPDLKFPAADEPPPGYILHITPERIHGVGPWATTG